MNNKNLSCMMCGRCCHFEIPITIMDIHRIALYLNIEDKKVFNEYIQDKISPNSSLFMIRKVELNRCIFLDGRNTCKIYSARPRICELFNCRKNTSDKIMPWTAYCNSYECRLKLFEQSVSLAVTMEYIKKNGTQWNEIDFYNAVISIQKTSIDSENKKIKFSRSDKGAPLVLIYDCSRCMVRGECAQETPVTLDDIRKITCYLHISIEKFFDEKLSHKLSISSGGLKLHRDKHCIFFDKNKQCTIKLIRPMHCRFIPCVKEVNSGEFMDRFYLGSGTIREQFRHQIALSITRKYVNKCGTEYKKAVFEELSGQINNLTDNNIQFEEFCRKIAGYRYVDDTLPYIKYSMNEDKSLYKRHEQ